MKIEAMLLFLWLVLSHSRDTEYSTEELSRFGRNFLALMPGALKALIQK